EHERIDIGGCLGEEHGRAARGRVLLEDLEPDVEVLQRAIAKVLRVLARAFEIVELRDRHAPLADELPLHLLQVVLEPRVVQLDVRTLLEVHRSDFHRKSRDVWPRRLSAAYSGGVPARTSATCSTRVFASPRRRSLPSMLSMQPRSPSTTASAPLAAM